MLNELITMETIQMKKNVKDWKEAIQMAAKPLLMKGFIQQNYVTAMIDNVLEFGPYIVVAPRIALAHARPEQGVIQLAMSLLCLEESVAFSEEERHKVNLIIVLAATDSETHLDALSQLSGLLADEGGIKQILEADDPLQILPIIDQYSINEGV